MRAAARRVRVPAFAAASYTAPELSPDNGTRSMMHRPPRPSDSLGARFPRLALFFAVALLATSCGGGDQGPSVQFLSIGTGGTGGIYYPLGGAIAALLSSTDPSRQYTAEVTGGSVENITRVAAGQIDMGFAMGTSIRAAFEGDGDIGAVPGLRIVAPLYPNAAHVLVREDAGIDSIAGLAGRVVSVGSAGSGTEQFARHLLGNYGLDYESINERFLSFSESSAALRDGAIDAAIFSVGYPTAAVLEAMTNADVKLLPITPEDAARLHAAYPFYTATIIPSDAYQMEEEGGGIKEGEEEAGGVLDEDLPTVAVMNWIVATESLDDEPVIALLGALRDRLQTLVRVNGIAAQIDLSQLNDAPIPLHPAAERWLRDNR